MTHVTLKNSLKRQPGYKIKYLNLYAGLGGNTHELDRSKVHITHIESDFRRCEYLRKNYPEDLVIQGNAKMYLQQFYKDYDFIWASPPCQSHSRIRFHTKRSNPILPDLQLYEVILFLRAYAQNYIVENVNPWYDPLIKPDIRVGRHLFWTSSIQLEFGHKIRGVKYSDKTLTEMSHKELAQLYGMEHVDDRTGFRNVVYPPLGSDLFRIATNNQRKSDAPDFQEETISH